MRIALPLIASFISMAATFAGDLGFSQMEDGDRIELTRHSTGCFHDSTDYFEVKKIAGSCRFREYAITWSQSNPRKIVEKEVKGEKNLTGDEIAGLDKLLDFYRGEKEASSTTQVSLLVEYFESDRRVRVERLEDGSGGYGLEKRKDLITLYALTQRLDNQKVESGGSSLSTTAPESKQVGEEKPKPESEGHSQ